MLEFKILEWKKHAELKSDHYLIASNSNGLRKPFLKWAGGKMQLINEILDKAPTKFNKYIEPFVGGGAVYFNINSKDSIISDSNEELIICYKQIKYNVSNVISILENYKNDEDFYYHIRSLNINDLADEERAARLIYLNKTCYNGLYRVNKKGAFNVPFGKRSGNFLDKETLHNSSAYLQNTSIYHCDYKMVLKDYAEPGDFIFLDPPYHPIGKFSDFKRYTKEFFYEKDQIELAEIFRELVDKGCYVMLTNSAHPFILDLYRDYKIDMIQTKRLISRDPKTRTGVDIIVYGGI